MLEMLTIEKYSAYCLLALGTLKTLPLSPFPSPSCLYAHILCLLPVLVDSGGQNPG